MAVTELTSAKKWNSHGQCEETKNSYVCSIHVVVVVLRRIQIFVRPTRSQRMRCWIFDLVERVNKLLPNSKIQQFSRYNRYYEKNGIVLHANFFSIFLPLFSVVCALWFSVPTLTVSKEIILFNFFPIPSCQLVLLSHQDNIFVIWRSNGHFAFCSMVAHSTHDYYFCDYVSLCVVSWVELVSTVGPDQLEALSWIFWRPTNSAENWKKDLIYGDYYQKLSM